MDRLPVRYAAIVCVAVSAMFMSGAGAVAVATPGSDSGDDGSNSSGGTQNGSTGGLHLPGLSGLGFGNSSLSHLQIGRITPPMMNLPQFLSPTLQNASTLPGTLGLNTPTLAPFTLGAPNPSTQVLVVPQATPEVTPPATVASPDLGIQAPTPSLLADVPPWLPTSQPVMPQTTQPGPLPFDATKPIVPQLLPAPLVVILMAAAQQIPLAGLVITPLLNVSLPPFIANILTPALLSDVVVPSVNPGNGWSKTTFALANPLTQSTGASLPAELGLTGADVPQAPDVTPLALPLSTSPSGSGFSTLSDRVEFRAGYSDYLRNAGMAQITAIAVPGAAAILLFTLAGGFIGYRQARAGHVIRAEGITRFLR